MYGESTVRVSHVDSGVVEKSLPMDRQWFGEGLAKHQDKLYQIVWLKPQGFIYSTPDLKKVRFPSLVAVDTKEESADVPFMPQCRCCFCQNWYVNGTGRECA
jgi:hypothetical protein